MSLRIRFRGGPRAGQVTTFGDDVERVTLGRDPDRCQVLFPPDETRVGREHCGLERVQGRYRLTVSPDHLVLADGRRAHDGQMLADCVDLQLGPGGPQLVVETISDRDRLPPTQSQGPRATGASTRLFELSTSARRSRQLAVTGLALVFAVAGVGWWWGRSVHREVTVTRLGVGKLNAEQRQALARIEDSKREIGALEAATGARLPQSLRKAGAAVYLVAVRDEKGVSPLATAWVAGPGRLGTNAHVAEVFDGLGKGRTMIVRSSASPPEDFVVESVTIHPGYSGFARMEAKYCPVVTLEGGRRKQIELIPACDVALLNVTLKEGRPLAPPLEIASFEELRGIKVGDPIGYIGYPMEQLVGVLDVEAPEPITHQGHVIALTDFFFRRSVDGDRQLLKHSLPTTGGSSGSPILNAEGQVIAIHGAGNRSPALVNFGQRIDLLQELIDGTAATRQAERAQRWAAQVGGKASCRPPADDFWAEWANEWEKSIRPARPVVVHESAEGLTSPNGDRQYRAERTLQLGAAGSYHFVAYSPDSFIQLQVRDAETKQPLGEDKVFSWWVSAPVKVEAPRTVVASIGCPYENSHAILRVYGIEPPKAEELLASQIAAYERRIAPHRAILMQEAAGKTPPPDEKGLSAVQFLVEIKTEGTYLLSAIAGEPRDIDLLVTDERGAVLGEDTEGDWQPNAVVKSGAQRLVVLVAGEQGTPFVLRVYGADVGAG